MIVASKRDVFVRKTVLYILIISLTAMLLFPFLWMLSTSVKPATDIFSRTPRFIPQTFTLEHYRGLWTETQFPVFFKNSVIVALSTTLVTLGVGTFFAYGLSRFRFKGRRNFITLLFLSQMFPLVLLIIPIYLVFINFGLVNTHLSLVISYCTFALPFSTLMLKSYFDGLPAELEEAALMDGCGPIGAIFRIVLPLGAPGIAAVGAFAFILSWQEFIFALTLTNTNEMRTLPVGISMMVGFREVLWGQLMAASVMVTLPVVILFVYFQKYLVSGMTMGSVKG